MNLIKYIILIVILLTTVSNFAQNTILGNIKDKTNKEILIGASIYLPDLKIGTVSDIDGNYKISNLKKGSYLLEISTFGYKSIAQRIELTSDTLINFSLDFSVTELNQVIVTGVSYSTELKRNPIIIKTIDGTIFNQNSSTNLIDALKSVPGISEITTGPNISKPVIRGLGYNRLITLNNGMRQEGQQWGDEHGIEIDEYSVDRVEIIKGPGSLMYGSDGIAGVLNFLPPKPVLNDEIKTQLFTNYQSNNHLLGYSIFNTGRKNEFQWLGRFSNKYAGNYTNKYDKKVFNSGFKEFDGNLSLGINKKWGHSFLTISSYNTKLGLVEGERDSLGRFLFENDQGNEISATNNLLRGYKTAIPYQRINHISIVSNNYFILNKGTLNVDLNFQNNRRREYEDAENPNNAGLFLSLGTFNYNIRYNFKKMKGWETSIGMGGMQQTNKNKGEEFLIPDYNLFDIGAFIYTQKNFNKLTLAGGLRFDNRNISTKQLYLNEEEPISTPDRELKFKHFHNNYYGVSGSIGLSYQTTKNSTLKFNFSQGFRAPNIAELASNGKHEGTFRYEIGNSDLKSEASRQIDLAFNLNSEHVNFEISPFVNFIRHYSFLEKLKTADGNDSIPDDRDPAPAFQYTSGNVILSGGEIYLDIHPHPLDWLHIENTFSYVQAVQRHQTDSTKYLPFIPAPHYSGGIKAEFNNLGKKVSNFYVKFGVDYYFAQNKIYRAYETETATSGYTLLSTGMGISFKILEKKDFISFYLSGNNLANIAYQSHLSRLKYTGENPLTGRKGVFNAGRNISIKMLMNF